jgi:hypothetical protein
MVRRITMNAPQTTLSLQEVARRLNYAGVPWAVFAGAAASVYGATRPLTDVDILIPAAYGGRAAALFPEGQAKRRDGGAVYIVQLPGVDLVAGLTWREGASTYAMDLDEQMAARLQHHEIAGVVVPVVPPEDNILLKALFGRGPEVGKHDWEDVQAMLAHLPALDWKYLRWRVDACGSGPRMGQAQERLEALWRQVGDKSPLRTDTE